MYIELQRSVGPELFADESDLSGVDLEASAQTFDEILAHRVQVNFPNATVLLIKGRSSVFHAEDERDVLALISHMVDGLLEETEWIKWDGPRDGASS